MGDRDLLGWLIMLIRFLLISLVALALVAGTSSAARPAEGAAALERLANCSRDQGQLTVMVLMDESGSLPRTDPQAQRVAAAQLALRTLAGLGTDSDINVVVAIAGFAVDFDLVRDWTQLDEDSLGGLLAEVDGFRDRTTGLDTDFAAAFMGARSEFAEQAARTSDVTCQLLLLFTDGDYDIEERDTDARRERGVEKPYAPGLRLDRPGVAAEVEALGRELLCADDGVLDELRSDEIVVVTIALEQEISDEDRAFLRAASVGVTDGQTCGGLHGDELGAYLPATDLAGLISAFGRIGNEVAGGRGGPEETFPVCAQERCAEGTHAFELNAAFEQFHVLANSGAPEVVLELRSPEADDILVLRSGESGSYDLGSVPLDIVWLSPIDVAIDGALPADVAGWQGTWEMTFVDPTGLHGDAVASAQLFLFGGLSPELVTEPEFRMGEESTIAIRIVDSSGAPRTPAGFVQEARISADITDPVSGRVQQLDIEADEASGTYTARWAVPSSIDAAVVNLGLRLDVVAQTGVALQPRIRTYAIPVQPPVTYPTLGPVDLRLRGITGTDGTATGTVLVTGGSESSGCVWFEGVSFQKVPRNAADIEGWLEPEASDSSECLVVGPEESREVELAVRVGQVASGGTEGRVVARLMSDASPEVISAELPFAFDMHRPVDQIRRAGLMIALLLIGFLLPLVVLWILNWWGARYESLARLRTAAIKVRVSPDGRLSRVEDATERPLRFEPADFGYTGGPDHPTREATIGELRLRSKVPLFPLRPAFGIVSANGGALVGSQGAVTRGPGTGAKVPFSLARQWVFTLDDATATGGGEPDVRGTLRTFLPEGPMRRQIGNLVDVLASSVPSAAQELARQTLQRSATPSESEASDPVAEEPPDAQGAWAPPHHRGRSRGFGGPSRHTPPADPGQHPTSPGSDGASREKDQGRLQEPGNEEDGTGGWRPPAR